MPSQPLTAATIPLRDKTLRAPFEVSPQQLPLFKNTLAMHQRCERYDVTGPRHASPRGGSNPPGRSPVR